MARNNRKVVQQLNRPTIYTPALLNTPAGRYAPDWDLPITQYKRVLDRSQTPRYLDNGPPGVRPRGK